ncbi:MAG: response regulator transcription factor [Firmicutes bacterium]|nr:response regulator transcription factor [Bacillota bacterium]
MRIAVCDDEALFRDEIVALVNEYDKEKGGLGLEVSAFCRGEALLETSERKGGFDLYLLDIVMDGMNGIELGVALRRQGIDSKIIYLTSEPGFAIDSFKAKPFDYILKPLVKERVFAALDEVFSAYMQRKEKNLIVKTHDGMVRLNVHQILYAQLCHRSVTYSLSSGETVESVQIRTSFSEAMQELLEMDDFMMCGAGTVANMRYITMVDRESVVFKNNARLYLPKKACLELRSAWYDYWFDGEGSR